MSFLVSFDGIFGDFLVGTGEPPPYCDKILTFMGSSKANKVLVNFEKKLGLGQTPPPSLGQNPNFYQKFVLEASLKGLVKRTFIVDPVIFLCDDR